MTTFDDVRSQLRDPAYAATMMHALPHGQEVDRAGFILERCAGKRVFEFGASGPMHEAVVKVAAHVVGVDRENADGVKGFDVDDVNRQTQSLPYCWDPDLILCGEVLGHLANPGHFLDRLKRLYFGVPMLITTPNAFSAVGRAHLTHGFENVNIDHVAWYSPTTLRTLLRRYGYDINEFYWYGGAPPFSQGMVIVTV